MRSASVPTDSMTMEFVGRILDIVFLDFEEFFRAQSSSRFETDTEPEPGFADDLQLWLIAQLLSTIYPGSLSEITETSQSSDAGKVLASSAAKPWEPSPWDPPKNLEMLSGYASRTGVPLVVKNVEHPWTTVMESVESEMRYLRTSASDDTRQKGFSALALPIFSKSGSSVGSIQMMMPRIDESKLEVEVRILTTFSRIIGEIIERQSAAVYSSNVSANIATLAILNKEQFRTALLAGC